ncbi:MAG TPA: CHY zinc finger protein [Bryobacteraceae bacterium]|nr:CHY zinc finger protein [Bryobacteraceae bacterium]
MLPQVKGIQVDGETRCAHYRTPLDIIAIKLKCCGTYYACKDCHEALAGHAIEVWPKHEWTEKAVLCGRCRTELTINEYMASGRRCPVCSAEFNPRCAKHYRFYFE